MSTENLTPAAESSDITTEEAAMLPVPSDYQPLSTWWVAPLLGLVAGIVLVISSLAIYHRHFAYKPLQFGVVDVSLVVEAKRDIVHAMLAKPEISEAERLAALNLLGKVEPELRAALDEIRAECECEILVKAAALTSERLPDYTSELARRLQITEEAVTRAREFIQNAMVQAGSTPQQPASK